MKQPGTTCVLVMMAISMLGLLSCYHENTDSKSNPVVGAWLVKDSGAPFPYHMYMFNADGTLQQANPDAGDPRTSDSDGKGVWRVDGDGIKGTWIETSADRTTHKFAGRTEINFSIKVNVDTFSGTEHFRSYNSDGTLIGASTSAAPLEGKRVTLP
jgi:hypothetical protein